MSLPSLPPAVYIAGLASFAVSVLLVLTKRWHGRFSMDGLSGVQKMLGEPLLPPEVPGNQLRQKILVKVNSVQADFPPRKDQHFIGYGCGYKL